jgi:hypothetical protein
MFPWLGQPILKIFCKSKAEDSKVLLVSHTNTKREALSQRGSNYVIGDLHLIEQAGQQNILEAI